MKPDKIEKLLDGKRAEKHLRKTIKRIFPEAEKILEIKIKPVKIYRDPQSFNLSAFYFIKMSFSGGKIRRKTVFAAADSGEGKKRDWGTSRLIYDCLSKNPGRVLEIPRPYVFLKSFGLFLREHIEGTVLAEAIKKNRGLAPRAAGLAAEALKEFQKIRIPKRELKKTEKIPNFRDLEKNIGILENRRHPAVPAVRKEFRKIKTALARAAGFESRQPKAFSHGDLNPFNIVITRKKKNVFLDSGSAGFRHPLLDVAGFCSHLKTLPDLKIGKKAREKSRRLFIGAYLAGKKLARKEKALFALYEKYFRLLALTHILVWSEN